MDWPDIQCWAEELAKLAPIGTALIALIAAIIAFRSLRSQKDVARKRAAIDFVIKLVEPPNFITKIADTLEAIDKHKSLGADELEPEGRITLAYTYRVFNAMTAGIATGVFDEQVCFSALADEFVEFEQRSRDYVAEFTMVDRSRVRMQPLGRLSTNWAKRLPPERVPHPTVAQ